MAVSALHADRAVWLKSPLHPCRPAARCHLLYYEHRRQNVATGVSIMAHLRRLPEKDHVEDEKDEEVDRIGELRHALAMHPSLAFDYMGGGNGSLSSNKMLSFFCFLF